MTARAALLGLLLLLAAFPARAVEIFLYQRGYIQGGNAPATTLTDAALKAFSASHPGITVRVVGVPWGKEGDLKLRTALLARRRIDCFRLAHDQLPAFIPRHGALLSPVDPCLTPSDRADFGPAALQAVTQQGRVMAWPLWSTALALVANTDMLRQHAIVPPSDRPWTWPEFVAVLRQVSTPAAPGAPAPAGLDAAARPPLFEWAPLLMAHCGPLFTNQGKLTPTGEVPFAPGLTEALQRVIELRQAGLLAPSFGVDDAPAAQAAFLDRRVAFLLTSPGFLKTLVARRFPFVLLPAPTGAWGQPITTGALGCFAVVQGDDPERVAAAHALARYFTSAEIARDVPGWYLAPPARASVRSFFEQPAYKPLARILPTAHYLGAPISGAFMEGTIIPQLQAALLGQKTPAAALESIQQAARRQALTR